MERLDESCAYLRDMSRACARTTGRLLFSIRPVEVKRVQVFRCKAATVPRALASLFGRLKSSAFRCSGARLQLSRGLLLLFGIGTLALPSWGRKNEVELSEKRPSASIRVRGACPVSNSPHSSSRKGQPSAQVRKLMVLLVLNTLNRPVYQAT